MTIDADKPKKEISGLEKYATSTVLKISGSILVLSIALNQIGFRVDRILDAWSEAIVLETKLKYSVNCPVTNSEIAPVMNPLPPLLPTVDYSLQLDEINARLERVESLAHHEGGK